MAEKIRNRTHLDEDFKDLLDRKPEIENLSSLLSNVETPCVMTLTSEWGSGKTTFIKLWEQYLKDEKDIDSIYFDAWENDFVEDPFLAFIGEIDAFISSSDSKNKENWEKAKKVTGHIFKRLSIAGAKFLTFGALDADKEIEKVASDLSGDYVQDIIESYQTTKNEIKIFRENLEGFLRSLENPLVIFVDELDRCKPSYTVKLLERIKHLFNVEGLIFVLSIDRTQLLESIRHEYGRKIESESYLRKFIDFDYILKQPKKEIFIKNLVKILAIDKMQEKRKKYREFQYEQDNLIDLMVFLSKTFDVKLRDIEKILVRVKLIFLTIPEDKYSYLYLLLYLVFLRNTNKEIYERYLEKNGNAKESIELFKSKYSEKEILEEHTIRVLEAYLLNPRDEMRQYFAEANEIRDKEYNERTDSEKYISSLVELYQVVGYHGDRISLDYMYKKIELLDQFILEGEE